MNEPAWVTREECLAIHEMMLARHGGSEGMRYGNLLESALSKPRDLFSSGSPAVADLAASYAAGIILNRPFVDGNKRTGFMVAAVFLEVNGYMLFATEESTVEYTVALAAGKLKEPEYGTWLKDNSRKG